MNSFFKILQGILFIGLLTTGIYYYKSYRDTQDHLKSITTQKIADQRFLVQSRYKFPLLSLTQSTEEKESTLLPLILKKFLPPQATLLHLGAHGGLHTILASHYLTKEGKILAFEGHPKLFSLLKENLALHQLEKKVSTFPIVPSSQSSSISVCFEATPPPSADTLVNTRYEQQLTGKNCQEIKLKPLDQLALPKIDFIFIENDIDTIEALQGASKLLVCSQWPTILIDPTILLKSPKAYQQLCNLSKKGYFFYKITKANGSSLTIEQADKKSGSFNKETYLLCSTKILNFS